MRKVLCVVIALVATSCIAQADTVYTSQAAWNAAVSGATTINFEGIANASCTPATRPVCGFVGYGGTPPSTSVGGVTFGVGPASPSGLLFVIGDSYYGYGFATLSSQDPGTGSKPTNDLLVTLPSPVTALAFDYLVDPGTVTITLSDGVVQTQTAASTPTTLFFGITDPGGFTSVDLTEPFSSAAESINMKDFSYATANPATVPEPSSLLFSSVVVVGMIGLVRRRRQPKSLN
jgi:hypothetical protein